MSALASPSAWPGLAWQAIRRHPLVSLCTTGVAIQILVYVSVYLWARMPPVTPLPPGAQSEAMILLQAARDETTPLPVRRPASQALLRRVQGPVFVKLHLAGEVPFEYVSATPVVIWDALLEAARKVRESPVVRGLDEKARLASRFKVDVADARAPILTRPEILYAISLDPGLDGLGVTVGPRTGYLDPDELLRRGLVTGYQPFKFVQEFKAGLHIQDAEELLAAQLGLGYPGDWRRVDRTVFRFRTAGFVEAPVQHGKRAGPLPTFRGNTPPPPFNRQAVIDACVAGGEYILRQLATGPTRVRMRLQTRPGRPHQLHAHPTTPAWRVVEQFRQLQPGQFKYIYQPLVDNHDVGGYSLPRHGGTAYSLALLYGVLKGRRDVPEGTVERFRQGAAKSIQYLADMVARGSCRDAERDFVCVAMGPHTDLGSTALPLVALLEYQRQTGDAAHAGLARKLANFLLFMQRGDGEFSHVYRTDQKWKDPKTKLLYYSGEAALALAMAFKMLDDPRYLKGAKKALDYLVGENYWPLTLKFLFGEDHWTCMAAEEAWPYLKHRRYATFCYEFAAFNRRHQFLPGEAAPDFEGGYGITPFFPPHLTPAGSRTEAMVSTYRLSQHRKETRGEIGTQIVRAFRYIVRHQVRAENAYLYAKPEEALGAIRQSPIKYEVRIDYIQHTIAAMLRALDLVPE